MNELKISKVNVEKYTKYKRVLKDEKNNSETIIIENLIEESDKKSLFYELLKKYEKPDLDIRFVEADENLVGKTIWEEKDVRIIVDVEKLEQGFLELSLHEDRGGRFPIKKRFLNRRFEFIGGGLLEITTSYGRYKVSPTGTGYNKVSKPFQEETKYEKGTYLEHELGGEFVFRFSYDETKERWSETGEKIWIGMVEKFEDDIAPFLHTIRIYTDSFFDFYQETWLDSYYPNKIKDNLYQFQQILDNEQFIFEYLRILSIYGAIGKQNRHFLHAAFLDLIEVIKYWKPILTNLIEIEYKISQTEDIYERKELNSIFETKEMEFNGIFKDQINPFMRRLLNEAYFMKEGMMMYSLSAIILRNELLSRYQSVPYRLKKWTLVDREISRKGEFVYTTDIERSDVLDKLPIDNVHLGKSRKKK